MLDRISDELLPNYIPIPMCLVNEKGKVVKVNDHINKVFIYDGIEDADFFALTGVKIESLIEENTEDIEETEDTGDTDNTEKAPVVIERNGRNFMLTVKIEEIGEETVYIVIFEDVTQYSQLKKQYVDKRVCVCKINIDNYDEMVASTSSDDTMNVGVHVDKIIREWAGRFDASINRIDSAKYLILVEQSYMREIIDSKFSILDKVRSVETKVDFPVSLSVGIGIGGKGFAETDGFATAALELALGRGGDQAVVKEGNLISYFGGKMQTVEKSNKGKSRVVAHALKRLIEQSKRVIIMGHRNPDMDFFGAALGINRLCKMQSKEAYIVVDEVGDSIGDIYSQAVATEQYNFVGNKKAAEIIDNETLLVVVDTHRPSYVENPELLKMTEKIVVIDHHRKAEDSIENPVLIYNESYASSTAELVSEILQFAAPKKTLIKLEAEALLAGMTVDTNRFAVKTGVRTFETAAWLRRAGADTTEVKRFFQIDIDAFRIRAKCIAAAEFHEGGIATSILEGENEDAQVINSQVADELLNIKGVKASFVAGKTKTGKTVISARSLGELNVQVIMERLGGGGHLTTAGAQVELSPQEVIQQAVRLAGCGPKEKEEK